MSDPFIGVAKALQNRHNYDPILWIGYDHDNSLELVRSNFPDAQYIGYWDAWRGIFPEKIEDLARSHCIDIDFLNDIARYELQAMKSMDRMDPDGHSFSFKERQRFFRKLLQYWDAFILHAKPDLFVSAVVPHRVFDFALYLVCKYRGVKTVFFKGNSMPGRFIPLVDIFETDSQLPQLYQKYKQEGSNFPLSEDIQFQLDKVRKSYSEGMPAYMDRHDKGKRKNSNFFRIIRNSIADLGSTPSNFFGSRGYLKRGFHPYWVERNKSIEESKYTFLKYSIYRSLTFLKKQRLERLYAKIAEKPRLDKPYVFFGLHYQPEATTSPVGGIFVDQMLAVQLIASKIPDDWLVYVKENPLQFSHLSEGQTFRQRSYYLDALKNPKIKFVPLDSDPFQLADNARAVATVSGTLGWEAMVRKRPVLIFGRAWYEYYNGVLHIKCSSSANSMMRFIEEFSFSEPDLRAYLAAFDNYSSFAYLFGTFKGKLKISDAECIETITNAICSSAGYGE